MATELKEKWELEDIMDRIKVELAAATGRSAWSKGVTAYAEDFLERLETDIDGGYFDIEDLAAPNMLAREFLNGAPNWHEYSWGGCALIYDKDIADRLCTPSEWEKTRHGARRPNSREEWLDVQERALSQAAGRLAYVIGKVVA